MGGRSRILSLMQLDAVHFWQSVQRNAESKVVPVCGFRDTMAAVY